MEKTDKECRQAYKRLIEEKRDHVKHVVTMQFDIDTLEKAKEELIEEKNRHMRRNEFLDKELMRNEQEIKNQKEENVHLRNRLKHFEIKFGSFCDETVTGEKEKKANGKEKRKDKNCKK